MHTSKWILSSISNATKSGLFFCAKGDLARALWYFPDVKVPAILASSALTMMYYNLTTWDVMLRVLGEILDCFDVLSGWAIEQLGAPSGMFVAAGSILYIMATWACRSCLVVLESLGRTWPWAVRAIKLCCRPPVETTVAMDGIPDDSVAQSHNASTLPDGRAMQTPIIKDERRNSLRRYLCLTPPRLTPRCPTWATVFLLVNGYFRPAFCITIELMARYYHPDLVPRNWLKRYMCSIWTHSFRMALWR